MQKTQDTIHEIRELIEQYRAEVPGTRRAWPEAIKSRVRAISAAGVPLSELATATGLAYYTIIAWVPKSARRQYRKRARTGNFSEVAVVSKAGSAATVTVAKEASAAPESIVAIRAATVTVALPGGIEVKGVTPEFLVAWLGKGGAQ